MSNDDTDDSMNRRTVLKGVTAGSVAAVGASTTASGVSVADSANHHESAAAEYGDLQTARSIIEDDPLLTELSDRGFLETDDAERLGLESFVPVEEFASEDAAVTVDVHKTNDDRLTPDVLTRYETDGRAVTVHVLPEEGRSYAVVESDDESTPTLVDPERDVSFGACDSISTFCSDIYCGWIHKVEKTYCCIDGYCYVDTKDCMVCF